MPITNEIYQRYGGLINKVRGGVEDIIVSDNFKDVMKDLQPYEQERLNKERYADVTGRLSKVDYNQMPLTKQVASQDIDWNHPELMNTDAVKRYQAHLTEQGHEGDLTPEDFKQYIGYYPDLQEELKTKGVFRDVPQDVELTEEELRQEAYKMANLSPEEIEFMKTYQPARDTNKRLGLLLAKNKERLTSIGQLGDAKYKELEGLAGQYAINDPKYKFGQFGDDLVRYTEDGEYEVLKSKPKKEEKKKYSVGDYMNMSTEELLALPPGELEDALFTLPEDKRNELIAKVPYLQEIWNKFKGEGRFAKTPPRGRSRGPGRKGPKLKKKEDGTYEYVEDETTDEGYVYDDEQAVNDAVGDIDEEYRVATDESLSEQSDWLAGEVATFMREAPKSINDPGAQEWIDAIYKYLGDITNDVDETVLKQYYQYVDNYVSELY